MNKDEKQITTASPIDSNNQIFCFKSPSVYKGEIPLLTFGVNNPDSGKSIEVGKLWGIGGKLSFEGNADESAKLFFEHVIKKSSHLLKS